MYKRVIGLILTLIFLHSVSALSTTLEETYTQGETMLVEITGSILEPLGSSDVEFLRGHVQVGSFEYDLKRLGDRYFLYAVTPFAPNNYTIVIHNVATFINGQNTRVDIVQNFTVTNETAPYTLKPGFIITDSSFDLSIILNRDVPEEITISEGTNRSLSLHPGNNNVRISLDLFAPGLHMISVGAYSFPLYNIRSQNATLIIEPRILEILPLRIEERFVRSQNPKVVTFIITNRAERELEDFEFEYNKNRYKLTPSSLRRLNVNETVTFNVTVLGNESRVNESFSITVNDETFDVPFDISLTDEIPPSISRPSPGNATGYYCNEVNGNICLATQQCSGESVSTLDGNCCRGTCVEAPKASSLAWMGYLIGGIVLVIGAIIAVRYFKASRHSENPLSKQLKKLEKPF